MSKVCSALEIIQEEIPSSVACTTQAESQADEVPPRVDYSLSEIGESMRPILDAMQVWGNDYKATIEKLER